MSGSGGTWHGPGIAQQIQPHRGEEHGAKDYSGRDAYREIASGTPRSSHHLPGDEIPEDFWFYRFLKSQVFFGMGAIG